MTKIKFKAPGFIILKEDETGTVNQTLYEPLKVEKLFYIGLAVAISLVVFIAFIGVRFVSLDRKVAKYSKDLNESIQKYDTDIKNLSKQNDDLEEKIVLLSNKLLDKLEEEEVEDAKHIPSGLPVSGMVSIVSEPDTAEGENDKESVVFSVNKGSKVMASGSGIVSSVSVDETYGFKVCIDHGNGFISEYCFSETPKVEENDEVIRGQLIYESEHDNLKLSFKIQKDEEYVDPMEFLEISG